MDQLIQQGQLLFVRKDPGRKVRPVELAVLISFGPKMFNDLRHEKRILIHDPFCLSVRIGNRDPQHFKNASHRALAGTNASCDANFYHKTKKPRRSGALS